MLQSLPKSELSLIDISKLPRAGMKGKDLSPWIKSKNYDVGSKSNHAYLQSDGVLVARLSPGELLLLSDATNASRDAMINTLQENHECYAVRRQDSHYWFAVIGSHSAAMFAKLCGVDLSPHIFVNHSVAQTQVARANAVIVRHDIEETLCYYLLGDSSTIAYMWNCLIDAMREFDGQTLDSA
jgi:sarcosine oxidase subunit gamma